MGSVLAAANQKVAERDDEIETLESKIQNLESELAERSGETPAPGRDLSAKKKALRPIVTKYVSAKYVDVVLTAILEILEGEP